MCVTKSIKNHPLHFVCVCVFNYLLRLNTRMFQLICLERRSSERRKKRRIAYLNKIYWAGKKKDKRSLRCRIDPCSSYVERWNGRLRWNVPSRRAAPAADGWTSAVWLRYYYIRAVDRQRHSQLPPQRRPVAAAVRITDWNGRFGKRKPCHRNFADLAVVWPAFVCTAFPCQWKKT